MANNDDREPTPAEHELAEQTARRFRGLIALAINSGMDEAHAAISRYDEDEVRWLLMVALGDLVQRIRKTATSTSN